MTDTATLPSSEILTKIERLEELVARVGLLREPDRILDGEIMFEMYAVPVGLHGFLWPEDNPSWSFGLRRKGPVSEDTIARSTRSAKTYGEKPREWIQFPYGDDWILMNELRVLPVTASMDAAEKLRPEGAFYSLEYFPERAGRLPYSLATMYAPPRSGFTLGMGLSHACAITAAAINLKIESLKGL